MLSTPEPSNRHSAAPDEKRHTSPLTPSPTNEPPNPMRLHSFASFPQQTRSPSLQKADLNRAADYFRPSLSNDDVVDFKDSSIEEYETPETSFSPFAQASQNLDGGPLGSGSIPKMTPTLRPPFSSEKHPGFSSQLTTGPSLQQSSVGDDLPPPYTNHLPRKKQRTSEEPWSSQWTNEVFFDQESCSVSDNTIYRPLEGNELRYVVLKAGQPKAPIRITFVTSNFDQLGQYEALSYVWGESICGESIEVETGEGTVVRHTVTKNLGTALRYLRDGVNDRVLWIDALFGG
jgi:Heterokaryon incompatibility protein (HET)